MAEKFSRVTTKDAKTNLHVIPSQTGPKYPQLKGGS